MKNLIKNYKTSQKGFTLVELLMYMGIVTILLVVLTQIFTALLDLRLESEATSSIEQDGRFILSRLIYDIHRAQSITTPPSLGSTSASLQLAIDGVTHVYSLQGTDLLMSTASAHMVNSFDTEVSNLSFRRLGNSTGKHVIQVTYTVTSKTERAGGNRETKTVTSSIGLR